MAKRFGSLLIAPARIQDDTIPLPVAYSNEIQGGLHSGETIADRNALPEFYRQWGMRYNVYNDGNNSRIYELHYNQVDTDINNNANWLDVTGLNSNTLPDDNKIFTGGLVTLTAETEIDIDVQINPTDYQLVKQPYSIPASNIHIVKPENKNRIDVFYLDVDGFKVVQGVEANTPIKPQIPINCIEAGFVLFTVNNPVETITTTGGTVAYNIPAGYLLEKIIIKADVDVNASAETANAPGSGNIITTQPIIASEGAVWVINKMAWANTSINIVGLPAGVKIYVLKRKILNV